MPISIRRQQEQQPQRSGNRQQQQSASSPEYQNQSGSKQQGQSADTPQQGDKRMGEGSYEGTRDYDNRMKTYLDKADVQADAEAAKPSSEEEAEELKKAEDEGLSHTRAPGQ
jgi:hypothetical protein